MYTLQELKDAVVELYKNNTPIPKPNTSARILKVAVAKICGEKKDSFYYSIGSSSIKAVPFDTLYAAYQRLTETEFYDYWRCACGSGVCRIYGEWRIQAKIKSFSGNKSPRKAGLAIVLPDCMWGIYIG